ncbi:hypothetical protein FOA52_007393 [Chlamydomonas sp. UWO 241]|nr:hypothetical protein FOA52_007393 [Chlamydomonas sp. UWO 241]
MAASSACVSILEKIVSKDKDFRYMATSDLLNELQKDSFRVDSELERKLTHAMLNQLEDASGDISGLAVKCLGLMVRKLSEPRAEELLRSLCDKVVKAPAKGKGDAQRDIACIGLKTVIAEMQPGGLAATASSIITSAMLDGAANKENADVIVDSLDILTELLGRFGALVGALEHERVKATCLAFLADSKAPLRKRAMHSLAALSAFMSDALLTGVVGTLLGQLRTKGLKADLVRSYVQAVGHVSRAVGYRFGKFLPEALPLVASHCDKAGEDDFELREYCLQALEGFVQRCASASRAHLDELTKTCLVYLKYDPNYADGDADDMEEDGGDGGDDDDEDEEEYSDDEDQSWKVRRAAAKCVSATIQAYPDAAAELYKRTADPLVARFREREENVLQDVFGAYVALCETVATSARGYAADDASSPLVLLKADVPATLKACAKALSAKSPKTRIGALGLLRALAAVLPENVAAEASLLMPGLLAALTDKSSGNSSLKIEALSFLQLLLSSSPPVVFQQHLPGLAPVVFANAHERYYKVAAEALRVCQEMVGVLSPKGAPVPGPLKPLVKPLFDTVMARMNAQDLDQEVKEAAILCMATVVSSLADEVPQEVPQVLRVLLERLHNEVTRLPAVRALAQICSSSCPAANVSAVLEPALAELTSFLRKANRVLRQAALQALAALATKYGAQLDAAAAAGCVEEASALVSDAELPLACLSLRLLVRLVEAQPALVPCIVESGLPRAIVLLGSPLLQGAALEALKAFFSALAASGAPVASADTLLPQLLAVGGAPGAGKQSQHAAAQCVAVLCVSSKVDKIVSTVNRLLLGVGKGADASQRLSLLCLGEIGRRSDLSGVSQVERAITGSLSSESEETKAAASLALGGIVCGNLARFMPVLMGLISGADGSPKQQYLLLQSLGEVIATIASVGQEKMDLAEGDRDQVLALLLSSCDGEEECRNVVAECLGRLALLHPATVLAALDEKASATSPHARAVVVSAIKYAVVERAHTVDARLGPVVPRFLGMMADPDRNVRKAAVVSLSAAAHHKPVLVASHLESLLPLLYQQTVVRPELVRVVDLGPFKHTIDDGLELRKAAFECMDILLDACRPQIEATTFMAHLEGGLQDHYDVKMPAHLLLAKLSASEPSTVLATLERIVGPLEKTLTTKVKSDAVKQELDRHEHMLRSCLRAISSIASLESSSSCVPFQAFLKKTVMVPPMREKYAQVQAERAEAEGGDAMDLS